ncbi:MAG: hypothetical protein CR972_03840, partial [Candidatus Moraniibacteriota bacterium]
AGRVATKTNSLSVTHPELAKEYSPKNQIPANKVIAGTSKKLWWICSVCSHEWQAVGNNRVNGRGCPVCARRKRRKKKEED